MGRLVGVGQVAVVARVVAQRPIGHGELQAEQRLVDVTQVGDLQRRVVDAAAGLRVEPDRREHLGEAGVVEFDLLQQCRALKGGIGEQGAVVGGDAPCRIARPQRPDQRSESRPQNRRVDAQVVASLVRLSDQLGQRVPPVGRVVGWQVAGALGIEHEQQAEQQGECGALQFCSELIVVELLACCTRPAFQASGERRQRIVANGVVEPAPQCRAERPSLCLQFGKSALGEIARGEQCEEGTALVAQQLRIEVKPFRCRSGRVAVEKPVPVAACEHAIAGTSRSAVSRQHALGRSSLIVEAHEVAGVCLGMNYGHGTAVESKQVPTRLEGLDAIAERGRHRPPAVRWLDVPERLRCEGRVSRIGQDAMLQHVPGEQSRHQQAPACETHDLGGDVTRRFQRRHGRCPFDGGRKPFAVHRTKRLGRCARAEHEDASVGLQVVGDQQISQF